MLKYQYQIYLVSYGYTINKALPGTGNSKITQNPVTFTRFVHLQEIFCTKYLRLFLKKSKIMDSSSDEVFDFDIDYEKIKKDSENYCSDGNSAIVKFYTADAKVYTRTFPTFYSIGLIKAHLANTLIAPITIIGLLYKEEHIPDDLHLVKLKPDKYGIFEFKLFSTDKNQKIHIENAYKDMMIVPDILTVRVDTEDEVKDVVVEVENKAIEKPYLGGYRNVQTGVQYHHGYTQTGPPQPKLPPEMKNHRDTQTYWTRNRKTENDYARAVQVTTKGLYIPSTCDKILTAGPYETAEEREKRLDIEGKVRTIQRYYRAWKMRKCLKELSAEYHKRLRLEMERDEQERREHEERKNKDLVSKVFPTKSGDFAMLYNMVNRWKKSEIDRITSMHCGPAKISEFYLLLDKEVEILRSIEKLKMKVNKDMETKKIVQFFKDIGSPIKWESDYKHLRIEMDTLESQKGREYFNIYKRLCERNLSKEGKMQRYIEVKEYLMSHSCQESSEIIHLIDRATELLVRGTSERYLQGLQKRIEALVLHHFKLEECNEGVTYHMKKIKVQHMNKDLFYCQSCQKLKPIEFFTIHARLEKIKTCTTCKWLDKAEEPWIDLSPHKFILKQIRNYERLHHGQSSIAFILQDRDIHFIVTYIWHGHSALSECNDIYQLRLVRWKKEIEWSPWNCILLTLPEAKAHLRVMNLNEVYEEEFINHVFNKHALAKKHFSHLTSYDRHFREYARGKPELDEFSEYYIKPFEECQIDDELNTTKCSKNLTLPSEVDSSECNSSCECGGECTEINVM